MASGVSWTPLASISFRLVASAVLIVALAALPFSLEMLHLVPRWAVELLVASYLPAAFLLAWAGVRSDRRGDLWYVLPERLRLSKYLVLPAWRRAFRSAAHAQMAYDWRNHGLFLPAAPTFIVAAFLVFAPVNRIHPSPGLIGAVLGASVGMTLYTAACSGTVFAAMKPFWAVRSRADAFVMTRPVTSGALVTAKFRVAWRSTLLTWAILVVGVGLWIIIAGAGQDALELWRNNLGQLPAGRAALVVALAAIVLPGVTWTLATQMLAAGLTGRNWLILSVTTGFFWLLATGAAGQLWCEVHPSTGRSCSRRCPGWWSGPRA